MIDLNRAVVVVPPDLSYSETKAVTMLVEEVQKRAQIRWSVVEESPDKDVPVIQVKRGEGKAEGYALRAVTIAAARGVEIAGNDARGVLFGIGRLLRNLRMERQQVAVPDDLDIVSAPHSPLRGHQLGYRPKTNSYDGWDLALWEQYIRDLAVFGANAIELIPPRSDDDADSPHFPLPPLRMITEQSRLADAYGLDVWVWYPAMDRDYSDPATIEFSLKEWGEIFHALPRLDAVFVPGGDPGHTRPRVFFSLLEKQAANLRRYHPKAQLWVSGQGFDREGLEEFFAVLRQEPDWLAGVVYGPQIRVSLPDFRKAVPRRYP